MTVTAGMIADVRRMVAEPTVATYSDATLTAIIERYPRIDERGEQPYTWDTTTTPPTQEANTDWIATYDLAAAAADVWTEKASAVAVEFDFSADGGTYHRSQKREAYQQQARYYRSRVSATTARLHKSPKETGVSAYPWIANLPENQD